MSSNETKEKKRWVVIPVPPVNVEKPKVTPQITTSQSNNQSTPITSAIQTAPPSGVPPKGPPTSAPPMGPPTSAPSVVSGPPKGPPTMPPAGLPPPPPSTMNNELSQIKLSKPSGSPGLPPPPPSGNSTPIGPPSKGDLMSELKDRLNKGAGLTSIGGAPKESADKTTTETTNEKPLIDANALLKGKSYTSFMQDVKTMDKLIKHYALREVKKEYTPKTLSEEFFIDILTKKYLGTDETKHENIESFIKSKLKEYFTQSRDELGLSGLAENGKDLIDMIYNTTNKENKEPDTEKRDVLTGRIESAFIYAFIDNLDALTREEAEEVGADGKPKDPKKADASYFDTQKKENQSGSTDLAQIAAISKVLKEIFSDVITPKNNGVSTQLDTLTQRIDEVIGTVTTIQETIAYAIDSKTSTSIEENGIDLDSLTNKLKNPQFNELVTSLYQTMNDKNYLNVLPKDIQVMVNNDKKTLDKYLAFGEIIKNSDLQPNTDLGIKIKDVPFIFESFYADALSFKESEETEDITKDKQDLNLTVGGLTIYLKMAMNKLKLTNINYEEKNDILKAYNFASAYHLAKSIELSRELGIGLDAEGKKKKKK